MNTCKVRKVTIPDYGDFYVRRASALLRSRVSALESDASLSTAERELASLAEVVAGVLCDENGKRVIPAEEVESIKEWDIALMLEIVSKASELNAAPKDLETEIKNSEPGLTESLPIA